MNHIRAIGFDLFNTLVMAKPDTLERAFFRLQESLEQNGLYPEPKAFKKAYYEAAMMFIKKTHEDGRETHNRFWISAALEKLGYPCCPMIPGSLPPLTRTFPPFTIPAIVCRTLSPCWKG
jgi:putative hydrolase of the HAD superfamily